MTFVLRDVRVFDGEKVLDVGSVYVENGVIKDVGRDIDMPGVTTISKPGHTLLPGLIDSHCHPYRQAKLSEQSFRFGITTIMDLHNLHENAVQQKQWARERKDFPDVKSCHFAATIDNGWPAWVEKKLGNNEHSTYDDWPNVQQEEDADAFIEQSVKNGADYVKLMHEGGRALGLGADSGLVQTRQSVQAAVVKSAHKKGLKVIAHALSLKDTVEVLEAGVDGLAHTFYDEPITQEVIDLYKSTGAWLNPTLVAAGALTCESKPIMMAFSKDPRVSSRIGPDEMELFNHCLHMKSEGAKWEYAIDSVRQLRAAGVEIICGSDAAAGAPGLVFGANFHLEMKLLISEGGLTTLDALRGATSLVSDKFGYNDRGRIAPGLKADLLLVEGNPVDDIGNLLNIRGIWRDGVKFTGHEGFPLQE